jgi:hypothetical protein
LVGRGIWSFTVVINIQNTFQSNDDEKIHKLLLDKFFLRLPL